MVINAINDGVQPNVSIDKIFDLSVRSCNVLERAGAFDMLQIATLLRDTELKDIRGAGAGFSKEMPEIFKRFVNGAYSANQDETNELNVFNLLEDNLKKKSDSRDYKVFLRRALGETLQEIADNPDDSNQEKITRERVRQIENKFFKANKKLLHDVVEAKWGDKNFFYADELRELYTTKEYGTILVALMKMSEEYIYLDFADCFVKEEQYCSDIESRVIKLTKEFVGEGINLNDETNSIYEMLLVNGIDFIGPNELVGLLEKAGYRLYDDLVTKGRASYALLCKSIIKEHFPNGIKLNQDDNNPGEDLKKLRELAYEKFGDLGIPQGDRAFSARLSSCLVICDRGKAIPEESIQIDQAVLDDIIEYIDSYEVKQIYYSEIFAHFEGVLQMTSNVNNHYFLHGVLMLYYPDQYEYYRDYLVRKDGTGKEESIADRIKNYICSLNRAVSKTEILSRFPGFSGIMIDNRLNSSSPIIKWGQDYYSCIDIIQYDNDDIYKIRSIITDLINQFDGVISERILFDLVASRMNKFIQANNMKYSMNLYSFCEKIFYEEFDFMHPSIIKKGLIEPLTTKSIVCYLLGNVDRFNYSDYLKITEKMKWSWMGVWNSFKAIEKDYIRITYDEYLLSELLVVDEKTVELIKNQLFMEIDEKGYMSLLDNIDYSEFPDTDYEWNPFVLEGIVKKYIKEIQMIYPENRDRRFSKVFFVRKESGIRSYPELVAYVFKRNDYTSLTESKFMSFLIINGLAIKMIPKEIINSNYFRIEKDCYTLT